MDRLQGYEIVVANWLARRLLLTLRILVYDN